MKLKLVYGTQEEIPEEARGFYEEKEGAWHFNAIEDLKTQADIDRLQGALTNEREAHKATKTDLTNQLTEIKKTVTDLEGKVKPQDPDPGNDPGIDPKKSKDPNILALQNELQKQGAELQKIREEKEALADQQRRSQILEAIHKEATGKIRAEAISDLDLHVGNFDLTDQGQIVHKESGTSFNDWFSETLKAKPHWVPSNVPAGAKGGDPKTGAGGSGDDRKRLNELLGKESLNLREQAEASELADKVKAEENNNN